MSLSLVNIETIMSVRLSVCLCCVVSCRFFVVLNITINQIYYMINQSFRILITGGIDRGKNKLELKPFKDKHFIQKFGNRTLK